LHLPRSPLACTTGRPLVCELAGLPRVGPRLHVQIWRTSRHQPIGIQCLIFTHLSSADGSLPLPVFKLLMPTSKFLNSVDSIQSVGQFSKAIVKADEFFGGCDTDTANRSIECRFAGVLGRRGCPPRISLLVPPGQLNIATV